jgi:rhomboid family GlyGly-CTERM serine protease
MIGLVGRFALRGLSQRWLFCIALGLTAIILVCWPGALHYLRYDRAALMEGQLWRVVTAHLVHVNGWHLLLNLAGLFLLCELLWNELPLQQGVALVLISGLTTSALLFQWHPELAWYAGLSGALHGLWVGCALAGLWPADAGRSPFSATPTSGWRRLQTAWPLQRCICLAGLVLLIAKLALEARFGASAQAGAMLGVPVLTQAHLYGACGGGAYSLAWRLAGGASRK